MMEKVCPAGDDPIYPICLFGLAKMTVHFQGGKADLEDWEEWAIPCFTIPTLFTLKDPFMAGEWTRNKCPSLGSLCPHLLGIQVTSLVHKVKNHLKTDFACFCIEILPQFFFFFPSLGTQLMHTQEKKKENKNCILDESTHTDNKISGCCFLT